MSPSSTSNSSSWRRVWREVLRVALLVLLLELVVRVPIISEALEWGIGPYKDWAWIDGYMAAYDNQLNEGEAYDVWMVGSSFMMVSLDPQPMRDYFSSSGHPDLSVQNYGLPRIRNLQAMATIIERWMFPRSQPQYMVIGVGEQNFNASAGERVAIQDAFMESMLIFPDSPGDHTRAFLYRHSHLYRHLVLVRHMFDVPVGEVQRPPRPSGGYTRRTGSIECSPIQRPNRQPRPQILTAEMSAGFERLDAMINIAHRRNIPVMVVSIPLPICQIVRSHGTYNAYVEHYITPLAAHLQASAVPFLDLDSRFHETVPPAAQGYFFNDSTHTNTDGAQLLTHWAKQGVLAWITGQNAETLSTQTPEPDVQ